MDETAVATFTPPNGTTVTVTTVTGFTNADFTVTAPLSSLTFDIPSGLTYSVSNYLSEAATWSSITFQGGGTLLARGSSHHGGPSGRAGINNTLVITNGTVFLATGGLEVGRHSNSRSNLFLVSNAQCEVGTSFYIGRDGRYNQAIINDNAALVCGTGIWVGSGSSSSGNSLLIDHATVTSLATSHIGNSGENNCAEVTNNGEWTITNGVLHVGQNASRNEVKVTGGGKLNLVDLRLGANATGHENAVIAEGVNSSVAVRGFPGTNNLWVGQSGRSNSLQILDGASFTSTINVLLANNASSSSNTFLLSNASGEMHREFQIGRQGCYNEVLISNGASLLVSNLVSVGNNTGASNNTLRVESGGTLTAKAALIIGNNASASNNAMRVENGTVDIGGALTVSRAGTLTLAGTNPVVIVRQASGVGMTINDGSALRFEFDTVAPTGPLIDVATGSLSVTNPGAMVIDAEKLARAGGGKDICLLQVGTASGPALTALKNSFDAVASTGRITLRVEDDLRLVCDVAGEGGTLILVK